jgi:ribosomal protein S18 acetylase RimI-like enzyme
MPNITIQAMTADQRPAAARVLARAFVTNPLNAAAFGPSALAANEAFFRNGLEVMKGTRLVAIEDSHIVGVMHWVESPGCRFSTVEKLRLIPAMISTLGLGSSMRLVSWLSAWSSRDPGEPHAHIGPIAVDPDAQRRRIGHLLMNRYCSELDRTGVAGYLETDGAQNVNFYNRFGFELTATATVLGVDNYFMRRKGR